MRTPECRGRFCWMAASEKLASGALTVPVRPLASATRSELVCRSAPAQFGSAAVVVDGKWAGADEGDDVAGIEGEGLRSRRRGRRSKRVDRTVDATASFWALPKTATACGADEVGAERVDVDDGAIEWMVERLASDGELLALGQDGGCPQRERRR